MQQHEKEMQLLADLSPRRLEWQRNC